ncbi:MAG TPA: hypothetical protein VK973_04725 [Arenicellales bacterium]|nr:hypothetical protein [Arenicellales bacterium]
MKNERQYWLDNPRNVDKLVYGLYTVCTLLFLADFAYHKHGHFGFEQWPGFYAWYGFISCVVLVYLAKNVLRPLVKRDEDYYDD